MSPSREKLDDGHPDWAGPEDDVEVAHHGSTVLDGEEIAFWQGARHGTSEVARSCPTPHKTTGTAPSLVTNPGWLTKIK
jgi:hypothetical protein